MRFFTAFQRAIFGAFLALLTAFPVMAQNPGMGPLTGVLPQTGQSDTWRYSNPGDSFEVQNIGDPNAIQYFFARPDMGAEGRRVIQTAVSIHPDSTGSAGLLYGLASDRSVYHMITLNAQGVVSVFRRDNDGFRPMIEQSSSAFDPQGMNTIRIEENGDEIRFLLNGTSLGSIGGDLFGFGAVGIGLVGDVRAFFNEYSDGSGGDQSNRVAPRDQPTQTAAVGPNDLLEFQPVQIVDTTGPAGQMVAFQTLVPKDWKTTGGIQWSNADGAQGCFTGARLIWGAASQDEKYGVAFLDPMSWSVNAMGTAGPGCLQLDLTDAEAVMQAYFQVISSVVQVDVQKVERPEELRPIYESYNATWQTTLPNTNAWTDAVVITARATSETSQNDSQIIAVTHHLELYQNQQLQARSGRTGIIIALTTPVGALDQGHPAFGVIMNNLQTNPQWQQVRAQWWAAKKQGIRDDAEARRAAASASASASNSVGDMMFESWKRREASSDASHQSAVNSIMEVTPYQTTSGQTVMLNQNYNHAWELSNGGVVMTNNANFNPMQSLGQTGQEIRSAN